MNVWSKVLTAIYRGPIVREHKLEVPAQERHLGEIRDFITRIAESNALSMAEINNVKLALDEACSNVVRHAYQGMEPGYIRIKVIQYPRDMEILVYDQGRSFEWNKARTPDLNRYVEIGKKGGLGIWFIRKLMDKADYRSTRQGNVLRLVKRTPLAKPGTAVAVPPTPDSGFRGPVHKKSRLNIKAKFLIPVVAVVGLLVFLIFSYMFFNMAHSSRTRMLEYAQETTRGLAKDAVNYLLKQDDLHLTAMVKAVVRGNENLAYAFVIDNENIIWAHSMTREMFQPFRSQPGFRAVEGRQTLIQTIQDADSGEVHDIGYPVYMGDLRLGVVHIGIKEQAIRKQITSGRKNAVIVFLIVLVVSTSGTYFLITFLVSPVRKLLDGMLAVSEGKLDHHILISGNDEFGQIAGVFNEMTTHFKEAQKNLLEQERIQQEMQVAQEIQHTLLPRETPSIEGYELASFYRSAKEVGGDYFDFVWVDDNILGIAVADVSGKGVPGSLVMTMIRTALRLEARGNRSAIDVMSKVNSFVTRDMKKGMFVTMFYIILNSRQRVINYSSAGHNPLILYREENQQIYFLKPRGFPLGIDLPDPGLFAKSLTQDHVSLKKGDLLLVYTDGITEAMNARREQFGEKRLMELVHQYHGLSADDFMKKLSAELENFTGDFPQNDDITCVAIKENAMADDIQFNLRRRLFYLVEEQGIAVKEACQHLNVSPSSYYRLKRLRDKYGIQGLRDTVLRKDVQIQQLSLEERAEILKIVAEHPEFGARRIIRYLRNSQGEYSGFSERMIYQELKRLRLTKRLEREAFAAKKKVD
jgi:serine phosphatase RsbU (regulator of sigma subunit)/anti-sigma regulatory factor (Ser/Thr protein kinase)/transposase